MDWSRWLDEAAARAATPFGAHGPGGPPVSPPPPGPVPPDLQARARRVLAATRDAEAVLTARREEVAVRLARLRRAAGPTRPPSIVVTEL